MRIPESFGMRSGWIYEVIASTRGEHGPHAAPVGILTPDGQSLKAELYKGSTTLANILRNGVLGLNLVRDAVMLQEALYHRERLAFTRMEPGEEDGTGAPFIKGAEAWLELKPARESETENTVRFAAQLVRWRQFGPVGLLNRAEGLLLESLVLSTRRHVLPADQVRSQFLENARVIAKVAPGSRYAQAIRDLLAAMGLEP
jgi:hypothetical protein